MFDPTLSALTWHTRQFEVDTAVDNDLASAAGSAVGEADADETVAAVAAAVDGFGAADVAVELAAGVAAVAVAVAAAADVPPLLVTRSFLESMRDLLSSHTRRRLPRE